MSESTARTYIGYATKVLRQQAATLSPAEKALILASLAQAEATLEVVDLLRGGLRLGYGEELTNALNHLARKMPDR
jgi:hypothetical protein